MSFLEKMISHFETPWVQNTTVVFGYALLFWVFLAGARTERWKTAGQRLLRDKTGLTALALILAFLLIGTLEMVQIPADQGRRSLLELMTQSIPKESEYTAPLATQTLSIANPKQVKGRHLLGTDALGRDTLIQTLRATKTALLIGGLTSAIYIPIGVFLGITAGYYRRWVDDIIQYLYSTIASVPEVLMLVAILMVLGKGLGTMAIALGVTGWVGLTRLIRGETLRQVERPYIAAAKAMGQSDWKILTRHILPNVMHLVVIKFVLGFSGLVLAESVLSYLGVGSPVGTPSWGATIDASRAELSREPLVWWNLASAAGALSLMVLSLNLFGDALRRAFDPRQT
jgi:peptide/nickel transport system permease protein